MAERAYTVLLVDDSRIILDRISEILSDVPCVTNIERAMSFDEAVNNLAKHDIHVAFLDINMPGKNGIELLTYIKQNHPSVKTVMLTNQSDSYYRNLCKRLGSDSFLDKSGEFDAITDTVMRFYSI